MPVLHPIFIAIFLILATASYIEIFKTKKKQSIFLWVAGILIVVAVGFRTDVGADYPVYRTLFSGFALYTFYGDVLDKALFRPNAEEIEWIFVFLNKIIFDVGLPFYFVTLVMAILAVSLKFTSIYDNVEFPALAALFYFMPVMFFEDSGQMRQGLGIAVSVFSFKYIKERNLWMFLLCMYIALGFHKTSIVFIPAYWLAKIPLNKTRIFWILIISLLISPLELYKLGGSLFENVTPQDVGGAYTGYLNDRYYGSEVDTGLNDIVKLFWIIILIRYDNEGCEKVWYYEYMRNLAVFGLAMFYFFRTNEIFAVRLPGAYLFFLTMFCLPNLVYAVRDSLKSMLYLGFMTYLTMMFFYFGQGTADRARFTAGKYQNVLW
ncbi:EpsG family protein [Chryseobacterium taklimakanense]|uniref:EpsG family protein n=1 Tax=Chryseobacterium taklimakanense TaxID=536441 RepID=A0A3G8WT49_9FLAO|nr:EpsG family protein [Chryseobacterium taklimakanense]AZI19561.1 EpsG family protein [Chryseobacterium taklimakanense]